ncbi:hypothetical protein LTR36_008146 [Oleoguttula mirabilis]|uniref:Uncharacterized protein n=1 Tax=Oleoguttula mirabilis TaxID=1507867 RepID=A0AAV9J861_9PEZI|nr:hypothetical protein LTR36_008146 [Oleoguttula mirabilis]
MTTFKGQTLMERFPRKDQTHLKAQYLAVEPQVAHPKWAREKDPQYPTLRFRHGVEMALGGYVNTGTVYSMQWAEAARFYDELPGADRPFVFDNASFTSVLKLVHAKTAYVPQRQYRFTWTEQRACVRRIYRFWTASGWLRRLSKGIEYAMIVVLVSLWAVVQLVGTLSTYMYLASMAVRGFVVLVLVVMNRWCAMDLE